MAESPNVGSVVWFDLSVPDAESVRDFYRSVVGWEAKPLSMGDYDDYEMKRPADGQTVTGICHARGTNAKIPPQWLIYISVPDVAASAERCAEQGGAVLHGPREVGGKQFCVIRDPAGAVAALIEP